MIRVFCSTNTCTLQRAQLHHAAQREATLRAQLAAVTAERDALAAAQQAELFERTPGAGGQGAVIAIPIENAADILRGAVELVR